MEAMLYVGALLASVALIWKAGDVFVDSACAIARGLRVSEAVIGLTVVSFATTAPEFVTSTWAAWMGSVGVAYGNAVGSCIANIGLVLAVAMMMAATIPVKKGRFQEGMSMLGFGGLVTFLVLDGSLNRYEALLLLLLTVAFLRLIMRREKRGGQKGGMGFKKPTIFFVFGALGVIVGSRLLIYSGVGIASLVGVSEAVIGFTLVAFGTSVPELATAVISASKKVAELSLGNIIGANILDLGWVLGVAGVISPLVVDFHTLLFSNLVMVGTMTALLVFMRTGRRLTGAEGVVLLALYAFYLFWLALLR